LSISIGGDSDTIACIAGSIAEAFYKEIPESIKKEVLSRLPDDFLIVLIDFTERFQKKNFAIVQNDEDRTEKHKLYNNMIVHKYWIKHFKDNPEYGSLRFKKLDKGFYGYPPFDFDETLLDVVDLETFIKIEKCRIPLFIGTQFGLYPWFYEFPDFYNEDKIIAILGKSVLTGHVAGLSIYRIPAQSKHSCFNETYKIISFKNEK
jgi:hypothetical protein